MNDHKWKNTRSRWEGDRSKLLPEVSLLTCHSLKKSQDVGTLLHTCITLCINVSVFISKYFVYENMESERCKLGIDLELNDELNNEPNTRRMQK